MGVLTWVFCGFGGALFVRIIMPGRDSLGLIGIIVLGILGAVLAGLGGLAAGWYGLSDGASFIMATAGAILFVGIYYVFLARRYVSRSNVSRSSVD